jgi:hypothetical protein
MTQEVTIKLKETVQIPTLVETLASRQPKKALVIINRYGDNAWRNALAVEERLQESDQFNRSMFADTFYRMLANADYIREVVNSGSKRWLSYDRAFRTRDEKRFRNLCEYIREYFDVGIIVPGFVHGDDKRESQVGFVNLTMGILESIDRSLPLIALGDWHIEGDIWCLYNETNPEDRKKYLGRLVSI